MPNHITCELTCENASSLAALAGDEPNQFIDFNKIVPMPELLRSEPDTEVKLWAEISLGMINLTAQHRHPGDSFRDDDYGAAAAALHQNNAIRYLTDGPFPRSFSDERFEQMVNCMRCIRQFGHVSWYEWSIANWGTKWNAYDQSKRSERTIRFDTANSPPARFLDALSKRFPSEIFRLRWADEDFGNNVGNIVVKNGEVIEGGSFENDSREAHELAFELKYDNELPEDMNWQDGKLVYIEEETTA